MKHTTAVAKILYFRHIFRQIPVGDENFAKQP